MNFCQTQHSSRSQQYHKNGHHHHHHCRIIHVLVLLLLASIVEAAPTITGVTVVGGSSTISSSTEVRISGSDLGVTGDTVVVTYDKAAGFASKYTTGTCTLSATDIGHIICPTIAGVGADLVFRVQVNGVTSGSSSSTVTYARPAITFLAGSLSNTAGGTEITLTGTSFGPASHSEASATYGPSSTPNLYSVTSCTVDSDTQMRCNTVAGKGVDLQWTVRVGGQTPSSAYTAEKTSYLSPAIVSGTILGDVSDTLNTVGDQTILLNGTNFGLITTGGLGTSVSASFGPGGSGFTVPAANCQVTIDHIQVKCSTVPLFGNNLKWVVAVEGQFSSPSTFLLSATSPTIENVLDLSDNPMLMNTQGTVVTDGSENVYLHGTNYGETTVAGDGQVIVTYATGGTTYTAIDCAVVVNHTEISCKYVVGVGTDLKWVVVRSSVSSPFGGSAPSSFTKNSQVYVPRYKTPTITSLSAAVSPIPGNSTTVVTVAGNNFGPTGTVVLSSYYQFGGLVAKLFDGANCENVNGEWCTTTGASAGTVLGILHQSNPTTTNTFGIWNDYDNSNAVYAVQFSGVYKALEDGNYFVSASPAQNIRIHLNNQNLTTISDGPVGLSLVAGLYSILIEYLNPPANGLLKSNDPGISIQIRRPSDVAALNVPANQWGRKFDSTSCSVASAHTSIECSTVARGTGVGWVWNVQLGAQTSTLSTNSIDFRLPELKSVLTISPLSNVGGEQVSIYGYGFGEDNLVLSGTYGRAGLPGLGIGTGYTFSKCQVQSEEHVTCYSASGGGSDLLVGITVDGIDSPKLSDHTISYAVPVITALDPPVGPASGGFEITITGQNFGVVTGINPPACSVIVGSTSVVIVSQNNTHIVITMPVVSSGASSNIVVTVAEQNSNAFAFYYYKMLDFSPHFGWWGGYTTVTVTGEGFVNITGVNGVVEFENTGAFF